MRRITRRLLWYCHCVESFQHTFPQCLFSTSKIPSKALLKASIATRIFTSTAYRRASRGDVKSSFDERWIGRLWGKNAKSVSEADQSTLGETQEKKEEDRMKSYEPALDGRGLAVLGMKMEEKEWSIKSFANPNKITSPEGIHRAVHRAVVEVYTNALNGYPGLRACEFPATLSGRGNSSEAVKSEAEERDLTEEVTITVDKVKREFKFDYGSEMVMYNILKMEGIKKSESRAIGTAGAVDEIFVEAQKEGGAGITTEENEEPTPVLKDGDLWTKLPFTSDDIKFAIVKRTIQLTGNHPSDNSITQMKNISHLLEVLIVPPPPTKLAEVLLSEQSELSDIPNIQVYAKRLRPLDRERMIGRLSPAQEEFLYEKEKIRRGEVDETELDDYRYPFEKRGYI